MTVPFTRIAAIAATVALASACTKAPDTTATSTTTTTPAPAAAGPVAYQVVSIPGSRQVTGGFLRINVSTGAAVSGWDNSNLLTAILDTTIPAGQYHLYFWAQPATMDGSVSWNAIRVDLASGRIWNLEGGGATPFSWSEVTANH